MATPTALIDLGSRSITLPRLKAKGFKFEVGDRLGTAVFEGYRPTHSDDWHEQRGTGYGGSDVAAICGCSKYTTPYDLWAERTGRVEREDDGKNGAQKLWGTRLEPVLIEAFAEDNPGLVVIAAPKGVDMSWRSTVNSWQLASPDALWYNPATDEWGIVEGKTSMYDYDWKDEEGRWLIPEYYRTQEQWYLDVFGFALGIFAVLFTGSDFHTFPAEADEHEQRINRNQVAAFDKLVAENNPQTAPAFKGTDTEVRTVRRMHPDIELKAEVELGETGEQWLDAKLAFATAEAELNTAASEVLLVMGNAQKGMIGKRHVVSRQGRANSSSAPWLVKK